MMDFSNRDFKYGSMAYLQECWVAWNCLTAIMLIIITNFLHTWLSKHNSRFYGKASLLDKLSILMNLDFAVIYAISIGK